MHIAVFGATGFLGRHLLKILMGDSTIGKITAVVNKNRLPHELQSPKIVEIAIETILNEKSPETPYDVVISLVGKTETPQNTQAEIQKANITTPKQIIDWCKECHVSHLVLASSINVRLLKANGYAEYKRQIEIYLEESSVPYTILRPTVIYGAGDTGLSRIYRFIHKFHLAPVFGDGNKLEQPIFVEEAALFFYRAALEKPENKTYEIAGCDTYTYNELMRVLGRTKNAAKNIPLIHIPAKLCFYIIRFFENCGMLLPINSEQILHIDTDLSVDMGIALARFDAKLMPFAERIGCCYKDIA